MVAAARVQWLCGDKVSNPNKRGLLKAELTDFDALWLALRGVQCRRVPRRLRAICLPQHQRLLALLLVSAA